MGISVLNPAAAASAPSTLPDSHYAATSYVTYAVTSNFGVGTYEINPSPSTATIYFSFKTGNNTFVTGTATSSGATVSLQVAASPLYYYSDTHDSAMLVLRTAGEPTTRSSISGTVDTITSTGTYNTTGLLYVVAVGAGGGGGHRNNSGPAGGGGGGGGINGQIIFSNTAQTITIGTGGNSGANSGASCDGSAGGNSGGATSFGNLVSANGGGGGGGGQGTQHPSQGAGGASGTPGNAHGAGFGGPNTGQPNNIQHRSVIAGSNGGGGRSGSAGGGSGIGTGSNAQGVAPNGFGSGAHDTSAGITGRPGVVYVLRGL